MMQFPQIKDSHSGTFPQKPERTQKYSRNRPASFPQAIPCSLFPYPAAPSYSENFAAKESGSCLLESILIVYEKPKKVKPVRKNRRRMQLFHMVPTSVCTLCPLLEKRAAFSPFCVSLMLCRRIFFYLYSTFFKGLVNASKRFFKKKRNFVNLYSRQQKKML